MYCVTHHCSVLLVPQSLYRLSRTSQEDLRELYFMLSDDRELQEPKHPVFSGNHKHLCYMEEKRRNHIFMSAYKGHPFASVFHRSPALPDFEKP